jgi:IS30 family transposase
MSYTQLSLPERIRLHHLRCIEHLSISETATRMERSKSTISRELKRNRLEKSAVLARRSLTGKCRLDGSRPSSPS